MEKYTFLQILNWMSESEDNLSERIGYLGFPYKYKIKDKKLHVFYRNEWTPAAMDFNDGSAHEWSKSEPASEEVEVVSYQDKTDGEIRFCLPNTAIEVEYKDSDRWRKVKVRFT
jgi:hypothetical protein